MFKKNTAITGFPFVMVNRSNGQDITTGTVTCYVILDGTYYGTTSGSASYDSSAKCWKINLLAAEMNGSIVGLTFQHTSALTACFTIKTVLALGTDDKVLLSTDAQSGVTIPTVTTVSGNVNGSVGSVTGNVSGSVGSIATNGITTTSMATGAITSAAMSQGAADKVWSSATRTLTSFGTLVADVATGVWGALTSGMSVSGSIGKKLADWVLGSDNKVLLSADAQSGVTIPTVTSVTGIATGGITSSSFAAGAINSTAIAPDAIAAAKIASGAITNAKFAAGAISSTTFASGAVDATAFAQGAADKVWSSAARTLTSFGTLVVDVASGVWNALTSGMSTPGSIGKKMADWALGTDNKALVSADTHTSGVTVAAVTGAVGSVTGSVGGSVVGSVGSVSGNIGGNVNGNVNGSVGSVTSGVTVASINANAVSNVAIANDAISAAKIAANAIGASQVADGAIDAGAIATGAITDAKFAADAISAAAVSASAVSKITSGLATEALLQDVDDEVDLIYANVGEVKAFSQIAAYSEEAVWIDLNCSNTNTVVGTDGIPGNPVNNLTSADTLAAALNFRKFIFVGEGVIILGSDSLNWKWETRGSHTLDVNGKDISGSWFTGFTMTGSQGAVTGTNPYMTTCGFDDYHNASILAEYCYIYTSIYIGPGQSDLVYLGSYQADLSPVTIGFENATETTKLNLSGYLGGFSFVDMTSFHGASVRGNGSRMAIDASCTGGAINAVGMVHVVDNSGGLVTINYVNVVDPVYIAKIMWDALLSGMVVVGSVGKKISDWVLPILGSDNRVLVSADTHTAGVTIAAVTGNVGGNVVGYVGTANALGTSANNDIRADVAAELLAYDDDNGVAKESTVQGLKFTTPFNVIAPGQVVKPETGTTRYKFMLYYYNESGVPTDPDSSDVGVQVQNRAGGSENFLLFSDFASVSSRALVDCTSDVDEAADTIDVGATLYAALNDEDQVFLVIASGDLIGGLAENTFYYVTKVPATTKITLSSSTPGGSAIALTQAVGTADITMKADLLSDSVYANHKKAERQEQGIYFFFLEIAANEIHGQFIYDFELQVSAVEYKYAFTHAVLDTSVTSVDITDNTSNRTVIAKSLKNVDVSGITAVAGSVHKDIMDNIDEVDVTVDATALELSTVHGVVDDIQAQTDQLQFSGGDVKATLNGEVVSANVSDKTGFSLTAAYDAAKTAATQTSVNSIAGDVSSIKLKTDQLTFSLGDVKATLDGEKVTVVSNEDKTGYELTPAQIESIIDDIWDELKSGHAVPDSYGDYLDAKVSSRLATADYYNPKSSLDVAAYTEAAVWIDTENGTSGTTIGVNGIPSNPVDNVEDARTIADALGLRKYVLVGGSQVVLHVEHADWYMKGIGRGIVSLNGKDVSDSLFEQLGILGVQGGTGQLQVNNCLLQSVSNLNVIAINCGILGSCSVLGTSNYFIQCFSVVDPTNIPDPLPHMVFSDPMSVIGVVFTAFQGTIDMKSMTPYHFSYVTLGSGLVTVNSDCLGGTVTVKGVGTFANGTAAPMTIDVSALLDRESVSATVWDRLLSVMTATGSIGKKLSGWVLGSDNKVLLSSDTQAGVVIPNVTTVGSVTNDVGITQTGADKVWTSASRTLTSFGTLVADISESVWDSLTAGMTELGSVGEKLANWVLGSDDKVLLSTDVQSGVTIPNVTNVTNDVGITQGGADKVWNSALRTLTSFGTLAVDVSDQVWNASVRSLTTLGTFVSDVVGGVWTFPSRTLTSVDIFISAVWDYPLVSMFNPGTIGKKLADWVLGTDNKVLLSRDEQTGVVIPRVEVTGSVEDDVTISQSTINQIATTIAQAIIQTVDFAAAVWAYATRTLTVGTKDAEIDQILQICKEIQNPDTSSNIGPGPDNILLILANLGQVIANARIWVSSDSAGTTILTGVLITDLYGRVRLRLKEGTTYYAWYVKKGETVTNTKQFVATREK